MKELFTRKLTKEEVNLIGCLVMLIGLLFIVLGLRSPIGMDSCLTYIGLFMFPAAIGFSNPIDNCEPED